MPNNADRLTRVITNLYTAVFEQQVPKFNQPLIDVALSNEQMLPETDTVAAAIANFLIPNARYYADCVLSAGVIRDSMRLINEGDGRPLGSGLGVWPGFKNTSTVEAGATARLAIFGSTYAGVLDCQIPEATKNLHTNPSLAVSDALWTSSGGTATRQTVVVPTGFVAAEHLVPETTAATVESGATTRLAAFGETYTGYLDCLIAEATTNLCTAPNGIGVASWTADAVAVTADATLTAFGATGFKVLSDGSVAAHTAHINLDGVTALGHVNSISVYVLKGNSTWCMLADRAHDSWYRAWFNLDAGTVGTLANCTATITAAPLVGAGVYRITITYTMGTGNPTRIAPTVGPADADGSGSGAWTGLYVYFNATQAEDQKAYATPYCSGALGTGCAWTGAANLSSSTRAAASVSISSAGLTEAVGSVMFALRTNVTYGASGFAGNGETWELTESDASGITFYCLNATHMRAYFGRVGAAATIDFTDNPAIGSKRVFYQGWDASVCDAAIDAVNSGTISSTARVGTAATISALGIGGRAAATFQFDAGYAWFATFSRRLTQTEVTNIMALTTPPTLAQLVALTSRTATIYLWNGANIFYYLAITQTFTQTIATA